MKIKDSHYNFLKEKITNIGVETILLHRKSLYNDQRIKDLNKRVRWDCFWIAARTNREELDKLELYSYLNDDHIDTALKKIMKEIGIE